MESALTVQPVYQHTYPGMTNLIVKERSPKMELRRSDLGGNRTLTERLRIACSTFELRDPCGSDWSRTNTVSLKRRLHTSVLPTREVLASRRV